MTDRFRKSFRNPDLFQAPCPDEVVEIPLLLSGWQAAALERAAHDSGLTTGEMVRSLLREFFSTQALAGELEVG
jgi:hypothetical protein